MSGADIFQRNNNGHLPRHCAKGNYILTKFIKMAERLKVRQAYQSYHIGSQYELLSNVTIKKRYSHHMYGKHQEHS